MLYRIYSKAHDKVSVALVDINLPAEKVSELLNKYRENSMLPNTLDFIRFLRERGVEAKILVIYYGVEAYVDNSIVSFEL